MSGICGLFNIDGALVTEPDLRAMTSLLQRRGPEGRNIWHQGSIGLGHTLLATTQELLFEPQPFKHHATGCVITADVRLDNREVLLESLDLKNQRDMIGDAELIIEAYLQWGDECAQRLLGDFAYALWDPRHQMLFCARDHFGLRPLYYHHSPGRFLVFASEPRSILVLPKVPHQLNEGRIADFLVPELEWIDYTSTFFEGVYRLPPGHRLSATRTKLDVSEYWKPVPGPELGSMSDEDYAQGFLEVFTEAVTARIKAPAGQWGAMLSGGMDSGSVVAVAKEIHKLRGDGPLHTFSVARPADADCAESRAIRAALSTSFICPTVILPETLNQMLPSLTSGHEEPFDGELAILKSIYISAHEQARKVVLDGGAGDVVLGTGTYVLRLIRQGQFLRAWAEILCENRFWDGPPLMADLAGYARAALVPQLVKRGMRRQLDSAKTRACLKKSLISPEFANNVRIAERFMRLRNTFPNDWTPDFAVERCNAIRPNMTAGRERYGRVAAASGIEACDPFLDKRVVDYCSQLPGHVRMKNGWPKMILRELMANRIPDEVRWSRGKPHLGLFIHSSILQEVARRGSIQLEDLHAKLQGYVNPAAMENQWRKFLHGGPAAPIYSAYILGSWLSENVKRPIATYCQHGYSPVTNSGET